MNKAYLINNLDNSKSAYFQYDAGHSRYVRKDLSDGVTQSVTHYIGNVEMIRSGAIGSSEKYKRYIGDLIIDLPSRLAYPSSWRFNYQLKDHLGSVHTSIKIMRNGSLAAAYESYSFDAWGKRRSSFNNTDYEINQIPTIFSGEIAISTRGYTGHEHLDDVGIIHMNGRIYDPELGRFLQADPFIQDPYNTQSLNRYTYVSNNPMSLNDPTGYWSMDVFMKNYGTTIAAIAISFIPGGGLVAVMLKGAVSGAITGGAKGALIGAFTAGAFNAVGSAFSSTGTGLSGGQFAAKIGAHGLVGGASSVLQGGKFGHGFVVAGATQAFSPGIGKLPTKALKITAAAIVGGSVSEATGGKFANGAITGAFSRAFNDEAHGETKFDKTSGWEGATSLWETCSMGNSASCVTLKEVNQNDLTIALDYIKTNFPNLVNKLDGNKINGKEILFVYDQEYVDARWGRVENTSGHMTLSPAYTSFDQFLDTVAHELYHANNQNALSRWHSSFVDSLPYFGNYKGSGVGVHHRYAEIVGDAVLTKYIHDRENGK